MRVLIADDEAPARERLRRLLAAHADIEIVAEAESGVEAIRLTAATQPEALLLDVQMPGGNGLDVAASLPHPRPAIIFCTAHEQHAVEAFELHAVDYLLKPVSRARLAQALDRLRSQPNSLAAHAAVDQLARNRGAGFSRFLVRKGAHYVVVPADSAAYFESVDGLTKMVAAAGETYWIDPPLAELEARLNPKQFFRISRNAIVNLAQLSEVYPLPGGSAEVALTLGVRLEVSRRRFRDLLAVLER